MKTRIIVYLSLAILVGAVFAFKYYPPVRHSEFVAKLTGQEIPPPVTSGESSPILYAILDMDGDGVLTTPLDKTPALFDHIGNGVRIATTWISPKDAFLSLDRNGNGLVGNGTELIGNHFKLGDPTAVKDIHSALSALDDNHDGVINSKDTNYSRLMLWQDINTDATCTAIEMHSLEQVGIVSIKTELTASGNTETNKIRSGTFEIKNLGSGTISSREFKELNFQVNTFRRLFISSVAVAPEIERLPDMRGSGLVRDMQEAASLSPAFAQKLTEYAGAETRDEQLRLLDGLVSEWGKTSGLVDMHTQAAQNGYTITTDLDDKMLSTLSTLEQFTGRSYFAMPWAEHIGESAQQGLILGWDGNPKHLKIKLYPVQLQPLSQAYKALRDSIYKAMLPQTRLKPYLDAINMNISEKGMTIHFQPALETFSGRFHLNPEKIIVDLIEFDHLMKQNQEMTGWSDQGSILLEQLLTKITPSVSLQKTLSEFSFTAPVKAGIAATKAEPELPPSQKTDSIRAQKKQRNQQKIVRKSLDLRYCLSFEGNYNVIRCTENAQR